MREMARRYAFVVCSRVVGAALWGAAAAAARGDVVLPAIIGDNMVLVRDADVAIWGSAAPGERIRVTPGWGAGGAQATADAAGRWQASIRTPAAGGPWDLAIQGRNTITLRNVLVGEVWLCSGQSNMEWPLSQALLARQEVAAANHPRLRLFVVENRSSAARRTDCRGAWVECSPETAAGFSAVAYSFGRELQQHLGVPVGLVAADWGGTPAEAWMSREALGLFGEFTETLAMLQEVQNPERRRRYVAERNEAWWRGLDAKAPPDWKADTFDDSSWDAMAVPSTFSGALAAFDGVVYLRRTFELPSSWRGGAAELELGPIDDCDDVWLNGVHVGAIHDPGRWSEPRRYPVGAGVLRPGRNVLAARVLDTGGEGGINGRAEQVRITGEAGGVSLSGAWKYAAGPSHAELPPRPQSPDLSQNTPSVLFNGMIAPLVPLAIRGVIWYQGESNRTRPQQYRELFPALIRDWRAQWSRELPFYYVQIAPFTYPGDTGEAALLREAQAAALATPGTGMVVTLDIGERYDLHPGNKQEVGRRLALLARARTYGDRRLIDSGPLCRSMQVEGPAVRLVFDHVGSGLELRPARRGRFLIAGADRQFFTAEARVDGRTLVVSSRRVPRPVAVRYAWGASPDASLFNLEKLPAAPFRTDDWSGELPPPTNEDEMEACRSAEPGFAPLFNGRDLSGWRNVNGAPSTWQARDGVIACSGVPTGVLRTERMYENFILELEWRHLRPGGNAGVFVWSDALPACGQPFTRSVEVQVLDGQEGPGHTSDGDVFPIHGAAMTPENNRGGSRAFPTEARSNGSPYWNHYRIECRDGTIALSVNGKVVTRGRDGSPRRGHICLESEGSPVEFRNIRLRELPASAALDAAHVARGDEGFAALYNGVDFSAWRFGPEHRGHWAASDWRIDFDGRGADLWSQESWRDFVLIADWRWTAQPAQTERPIVLPDGSEPAGPDGRPVTRAVPDAGDSGIYLRGSSRSQVNIWCWPVGSGEVYGYRTDPSLPPEVRAAVTPRVAADAPIGQWNRFVITMSGDRLTVVLNGKTVIENAALPGVPESGPIGLQQHGSPIQFANLYIRGLE